MHFIIADNIFTEVSVCKLKSVSVPRLISTILTSVTSWLLLLFPQFNAGSNTAAKHDAENIPAFTSTLPDSASIDETTITEYYDSLKLQKFGLKKEAFSFAYKGYRRLLQDGKLNKEGILTICDFSQSSRRKRLYLIDLVNYKLILNTHVAHGRNSGGEYAKKFSNRPESLQSSLGFYVTKRTYWGEHGLALTIAGVDKGFNDKAERRKIVVHGSSYVGDNILRYSRYIGRSFGCPAVPKKYSSKLIHTIKNGSCLFIYHPSRNYLTGSTILNG